MSCREALDDEDNRVAALAVRAQAKAKLLALAMAGMPFPAKRRSSRATWEAVARAYDGVLVPSGPAIAGLTMRVLLTTGEVRTYAATIRTRWHGDDAFSEVQIDFGDSGVTSVESLALARRISSQLPGATVAHLDAERAVFTRPGFASDPNELVRDIGAALSCVLEARDERRGSAPYR